MSCSGVVLFADVAVHAHHGAPDPAVGRRIGEPKGAYASQVCLHTDRWGG